MTPFFKAIFKPGIILTAVLATYAAVVSPVFAQDDVVPAYVGSQACAGCHAAASEYWTGSDHALAWTLPSTETVIADFDGTEFAHDGMQAQFRIEGEKYFVAVTEKDGTTTDYPVHSVGGIRPLQQYLLETEPGRLQSFDVVWDAERMQWYHLYPDQDLPPSDGFHWTGPYKNWNARCAECHATGFVKNYDIANRSYASTQAEMGVGCEACHGPGAAHLAWTEGKDMSIWGGLVNAHGLTMTFDNAESTIQQCAGCHSRREALGDGNPLPGTPYADNYNLALLRPDIYHADGQILDEVYVYGSFLQSKMYARGVSCINCHDAHSTELKADGNSVCTQCHSPAANPDFPTLKPAIYDSPEHHFHQTGSTGAECKSCHMIERVYMGVDGRRDHSFRIPRPDLSSQTGGPNACNDCHSDETPDWAASKIKEWFPDDSNRGPSYGQTLALGSTDALAAEGQLIGLAGDPDRAGIVRATALWLLQQGADAGAAEKLAPLLDNPDPVVRAAAVGLQRLASPQDRAQRVFPLLSDPVRNVRIQAARQFLDLPIAHMPENISKDLNLAMGEWQLSLGNRLDFPEAHLVLGGIALTMRDPAAASDAFREVTRLDPQRVPAWVMMVRIAAATSGLEAAGTITKEALAINPEDPQLRQLSAEIEAASGQ